MLRFILFLRSISWTSTLSALAILATLIDALIDPHSTLSIPLGLASIALALLSLGR